MKRPKFKDYFPEATNPIEINTMFLTFPAWYQYNRDLDEYVDKLETQFNKIKELCDEVNKLEDEEG